MMKQMAAKSKYLLLVIMVLCIMALAAAPAGAAREMPVHIASSDGTPGATADYTFKAYLQTDWGNTDWLVVHFPFEIGNNDYVNTSLKYTTASGTFNLSFMPLAPPDSEDNIYVVDRYGIGNTIPAGSLIELTLPNIPNPPSEGKYTFNVETMREGRKTYSKVTHWGEVKDSGSFDLKLPGHSSPLNLTSSVGGSIRTQDPVSENWYAPGTTFTAGTLLRLQAVPDSGWAFACWEGSLVGMDYFPPAFFVDGGMNITAVFVDNVYLDVSWDPPGRGTVSPGSGNYPVGSLTLTAEPSPGWHVDVWEVTDPLHGTETRYGGNSESIYMDRDKSLLTQFRESQVHFNITSDPAPGGSVAVYPHGDTFKGTSTQTTWVELTATSAPGYRFDRWEYQVPRDSHANAFESYTSTDNPLSFEVDTFEIHNKGYGDRTYLINGPVNVKAVFVTTDNFQLTTFLAGYGSIVRSIEGPDYEPNTKVTLTAIPSAGTEFSHWSGDLDGLDDKANPITVVMDSHKTIGAHFVSYDYDLTVICNPAEGGSVTLDPPGGTYPYRTYVNLTATPNPGWYVTSWSGIDISGGDSVDGNKAVIVLRDNRTVTANFAESPYNVTYDANGGTGTAPDHDNLREGDNFTAVANPFTAPFGTLFKEWNTTADGSGTGYAPGATVTMPAHDLTLYAIWESGLFFSEYVCGSGYNKALEIYNPSDIEVDLAAGNYKIEIYFTLYSAPDTTINLTGTIPPRSVYVIARVDADQVILGTANQTTSQKMFTGNDTIVLSRGTVILDVFGRRGEKPTYGWKSGDIQTWNTVLRRLPGVTQGDRNPFDAFDPALEWGQFDSSDFSGLGWHLVYPAISIDDVSDFEGDNGATDFTFTVSLSSPAGIGGVTFDIATADGTAAAPEDYIAKSLTGQTIPEGNSSYTFTVQVIGDTLYEPDKTFYVNITNVTGAIVAKGQGVGTILNDDAGTFTVTFDSQDGSPVDSQTVNQGGLVTRPADPTKEDFDFAGWFTDTDYNTQWDFSTDTVTANITLYAWWTETTPALISLTVATNPADIASTTGSGEYASGEAVEISAPASVDIVSGESRYLFTGWSGDGVTFADPSVPSTTLTMPAGAVTVTANYVTQYRVTFAQSGIGDYSADRITDVVVTVDGITKTAADLPFTTDWLASGTFLPYNYASPVGVYFYNETGDVGYLNERYTWASTSGLSQTQQGSTFAVTAAGTVTASYDKEYEVVFGVINDYLKTDCTATEILTVTVNGIDKTGSELPFSIWAKAGDELSYEFAAILHGTSGTQYVWFGNNTRGDLSNSSREATLNVDRYSTAFGVYCGSLVTVSPTAQQYGDEVTFNLTVSWYPYFQTFTDVHFYIGTQDMGGVVYDLIDQSNNAYSASLTVPLLETVSGQLAAGTKVVTAKLGNQDSVYNPTTTLTILNTPAGEEVSVPLLDETSSTAPVTVTFSEVTVSGITTLSINTDGPASPSGFSFGDPPVFYDIETSAEFTGTARVCLTDAGLTDAHRLLHFEDEAWVDVTVLPVDLDNGIICGEVTSFSPFVIATVIKAEQSITFGVLDDKTYGDDPFDVSAVSSSGLPVSFAIKSGPASISGNTVTITGAGTVIITATQAGNTYYYAAPDVEQSFSVTRADASVTPDDASKTYGDTDPTFTGTLDGFLAADGVSATYSRTAGESVGTYTISATLSPSGVLGNYTITSNTAQFAIDPRGVTVKATAGQSKVYGEADPTFTYQVTGGLLVADDNFSGALTREEGEHVGSYAIQQGSLALSSNYELTYVGADFIITPAAVNILYNGDQIVKLGESFVAKAQLKGPNAMSIEGIKVCFFIEDDTGERELGAGTTNSSGLVTLDAIETNDWISGVYTIIARTCEANVTNVEDEATLTVADPGDAATGGGWYTLSGAGRVNFGFTVRWIPGTDPVQYKGQILLINNEKWRLKGELNDYVSVNNEGAASGTGKLYKWDAALNEGLGDWVLVDNNVSFTISFADYDAGEGTGKGKKTITPDTFGIHIDYMEPTLPNSSLTELKGGNIDIKITNDDSGDTGDKAPPGQDKKK